MDPGAPPATATKEGRSCILVTGLTALLYIYTTHTTHDTHCTCARLWVCPLYERRRIRYRIQTQGRSLAAHANKKEGGYVFQRGWVGLGGGVGRRPDRADMIALPPRGGWKQTGRRRREPTPGCND